MQKKRKKNIRHIFFPVFFLFLLALAFAFLKGMDGAGSSEKAKAAAAAFAARSRPSLRVVTRSSSGGGANGGGKAGSGGDDDDEFHEFSDASVPAPSPRLSGGRGTPRTPPPGPGLAAALSVGIEAGHEARLMAREHEGGEEKKSGDASLPAPKEDQTPPPSSLAAQQKPSLPLPAAPAGRGTSPVAGGGPPSPGDALFRVKDLDTGRELKVLTVSFNSMGEETYGEESIEKKNRDSSLRRTFASRHRPLSHCHCPPPPPKKKKKSKNSQNRNLAEAHHQRPDDGAHLPDRGRGLA